MRADFIVLGLCERRLGSLCDRRSNSKIGILNAGTATRRLRISID